MLQRQWNVEVVQLEIESQDIGEKEGEEDCPPVKGEYHPSRERMIPEEQSRPGSQKIK